jgi:hypothetical protein
VKYVLHVPVILEVTPFNIAERGSNPDNGYHYYTVAFRHFRQAVREHNYDAMLLGVRRRIVF